MLFVIVAAFYDFHLVVYLVLLFMDKQSSRQNCQFIVYGISETRIAHNRLIFVIVFGYMFSSRVANIYP